MTPMKFFFGSLVVLAAIIALIVWLISATDFGEVGRDLGRFFGEIQQGIEEGKQE